MASHISVSHDLLNKPQLAVVTHLSSTMHTNQNTVHLDIVQSINTDKEETTRKGLFHPVQSPKYYSIKKKFNTQQQTI